MPVYASTEGFAGQGRHPRALMFIVGGHAVLVAAVMTAKMEVITLVGPTKTIVELIEEVKPPPPLPPEPVPPKPEHPVQPRDSQIDLQKPIVPILTQDPVELAASLPQLPSPGPIGSGTESIANPTPRLDPVRIAARFATPDSLLRPPYPDDKARLEEEGTLRLRLSIDERGRVVAVEPVGKVDRPFFESARKHLLSKWRYKPATVDGRPVPSSTVITLRFELET
jgi:protein TonB